MLSRNDEKNALLDLHVELRHKLRNMPPPLQEPYTEDMRLDHEWKHMNKGKDYKQYFQARMRRDDVSNLMFINLITFY